MKINTAIIVRNLYTTNEHSHADIRFERMADMVLHDVNGKSYFSNGKYLADRMYNGETLGDCRIDESNATSSFIEVGPDYDVEVTSITLKLRHERVIPR
jgi:hypothetical protein